ncbi:PulJ/GspJ family protein [Actomonas aquatica]|uniref:Prepilin-type N-terminal cleavage/methylation domain-containing protein n=1 Tax=Actomonas aquatica TaxID=2866162 RepID=A0ABZ1C9H7_9BACT|nr:prepilin-type N-terminal cleavage/methylation domain-containing protein [Opitutus sp. WL0086]WRQ88126.1 prepilin-type N-terminal cleavage/methylation domain-containing protein [Opitutus sp. WL0086]
MKRRGFSLVELIVAVGITAVLAAVLLVIVSNTLEWWSRSAGALKLDNEANRILERMATDLQSAYARRDGIEWLRVPTDSSDVWVLRLFGNLANTSGATDDPATLREVSYRYADRALYRFESTASQALNSNYGWRDWSDVSDAEYLLGNQVEDLSVSFSAADDRAVVNPSSLDWPSRARLELTLINEDGVRRLAAIAAGASNESIQQVRTETTRRFVRWVEIIGRPL